MANSKNSQNKMDTKEEVLLGAGLAALAAGAYFFLGPKGKKHQKQMRGWMVKMKGEVLERLEEVRDISEPIYNEIVDTVARTNEVAGKIPRAEIRSLAEDLKKQWRTLNRGLKGQRTTRRSATAGRKPAAKRNVKKNVNTTNNQTKSK